MDEYKVTIERVVINPSDYSEIRSTKTLTVRGKNSYHATMLALNDQSHIEVCEWRVVHLSNNKNQFF